MPVLSHPAFGPKASLVYITVGCLLDIWVAVWYFAFVRGGEAPPSNTTWFWLYGLFLTGLMLLVIGIMLGKIGQAARRAELPPSEALPAEAAIQQTAAANQPAITMPPGTVVPGTVAPMVSQTAPSVIASPPAVASTGVPVTTR